MAQVTELQLTINLGEPEDSVHNVVYEFITNALDASPTGTIPLVTVEGQHLVIEDEGSGIESIHFKTFGPPGARDPSKHGSHGLGLKDAVACSVRLGIPISIETVGNTLTFHEQTGNSFVHLQEQQNDRTAGTKITITSANAMQVYNQAKARFLFLMDPKPTPSESSYKWVEMYEVPPGKGAIMMKGVKKIHVSPPLDFIYNFIKPTTEQKNSISRSHTLIPRCFRKHFRSDIFKANPKQSFNGPARKAKAKTKAKPKMPSARAQNPPSIAASATPLAPVAAAPLPRRPAQEELARDMDAHCMLQDYHVWTLTTDERDALHATAGKVVNFLRTIPDVVSVAATSEQGSLAKNTFVPLSSDIDIVVEINDFHRHEKLISKELKQLLRDHGCRMEDSGNHILNFSFQGVAFDLVLIDAAKTDERSKSIHEHGARTAEIVAADRSDHLKLQSFIRCVKYWSKRQGIAIKSCSLEMAVLAMWPRDGVLTKTLHPFRHFLRGVTAELNQPAIKDYYELTVESIADVAEKALATLELLNKLPTAV